MSPLKIIHWDDPVLRQKAAHIRQIEPRHRALAEQMAALMYEASGIGLAANQVEYHPYLNQRPLLDLMRSRGLVLIAHSPLARGKLLDDPVMQQIAKQRHGAGKGLYRKGFPREQ